MTTQLVAPVYQERSRRSLQRIVAAAEMVLRQEGEEGFSIAAIAEASGISVGGIYARVKGKQELLLLVKEAAMGTILAAVSKKLRQRHADSGSVIDSYIEATMTPFQRDSRLHSALFAQGNSQSELAAAGRAARAKAGEIFAEAIVRADPELADNDIEWMTFCSEMITFMIMQGLNTAKTVEHWAILQTRLSMAAKGYFQSLKELKKRTAVPDKVKTNPARSRTKAVGRPVKG